jgi:hypothetical protein
MASQRILHASKLMSLANGECYLDKKVELYARYAILFP